VQVSASEGLANHTVPESCAEIREGFDEALTGVRIGWVLSRYGSGGSRSGQRFEFGDPSTLGAPAASCTVDYFTRQFCSPGTSTARLSTFDQDSDEGSDSSID
jgi:hypothetical protein